MFLRPTKSGHISNQTLYSIAPNLRGDDGGLWRAKEYAAPAFSDDGLRDLAYATEYCTPCRRVTVSLIRIVKKSLY